MKNFGTNQLVFSVVVGFMLLFNTACMKDDLEIDETSTTGEVSNGEDSNFPETAATDCAACDFYIEEYITDGAALGIKPGDVVCLRGGQHDRVVLRNIVGTPEEPVIIRNCDGVASIYSTTGFGMKFEYCKNFKLLGNGSDDKYGIKVSAEKGFFITMEKFTTDFEISRVEVAGPNPRGAGENAGFAGIGIKTSPYQDCELFTDPTRKAWIMRNVQVHHNYIHDTGGEGLYIGHGFYKGRQEANCSVVTYSHSIKNIQVYENLIENVGFDGIQIKNADENVKVYNNIVRNFGCNNVGAHNEGLFLGEGTTGKFFGNIIDTGSGNGCMIQGLGNIDMFNNVFANPGDHGVYIVHGSQVVRFPDGYFNVFNNTVYNSGTTGFVFYNNDGGPKRFMNNLVIDYAEPYTLGADVEMKNNIFTTNIAPNPVAALLSKTVALDFGKLGVDKGADLSGYGLLDDCFGTARPVGRGYDIGAFEK